MKDILYEYTVCALGMGAGVLFWGDIRHIPPQGGSSLKSPPCAVRCLENLESRYAPIMQEDVVRYSPFEAPIKHLIG